MLHFTIRKDIQDIINVGIFRNFARQHGVDHQGNKHNIVMNIVLAVRNNQLDESEVRSFIQEQLWYGKNKHTFFIEIAGHTVETFKDTELLLEYFDNRGIKPFNNMDKINIPDGISLARFQYELNPLNDSVVNKVFLGFVEKNYVYRFEGHGQIFEPVNTYICAEFDLINNLLILRIRSRARFRAAQDVNSQNLSSNYLAKKYLKKLEENYGIEYLDGASEEIKNTMYNIECELTNFVMLQFYPKVIAHEKLIDDFTVDISTRLGLQSNTEPINLRERIIGLLERALIVQNENVIESYVDGKVGYINMFDFKDDRGGRINARSKHHSTPIQTSDIFFDTRETINEVKLLDNLWVVWFKKLEDGQDTVELVDEVDPDEEPDNEADDILVDKDNNRKVIRIKTKIAAFKGYYKIDFKRYLLKEEYDHVLSLIETFRRV